MITITRDQYRALEASSLASFESRVLAHLRRCFPDHVAKVGEDQARAAIREGIARAEAYGITAERQVCVFIDLMFALGERFDRDPKYPWAPAILLGLDRKAPATRIDRLYDRALAWLRTQSAAG
jgi:hypothetical protein